MQYGEASSESSDARYSAGDVARRRTTPGTRWNRSSSFSSSHSSRGSHLSFFAGKTQDDGCWSFLFRRREFHPPQPSAFPVDMPSATPQHSVSGRSTASSSGTRHLTSSKHAVTQKQFQSCIFTLEEILRATRNFSPSLKIGQGGFGTVYKGILEDGTAVAVKRAKKGSHHHVTTEFMSEIKIMAQVEHHNLVKFYGYMECGDERIVVVEFVPNGTLREHLDGHDGKFLDLVSRLDIAIDVAHAVTYLHMYSDHPIIHRDIKATNILITNSLRAKVADFGFARLGAGDDSGKTHVSTVVKGTVGYMDPEYLKTSHLTEKSDVYSFGVLLVEIMSSRRPVESKRKSSERVTLRWAMQSLSNGMPMQVLDPLLPREEETFTVLEKVLKLAFRCVGDKREERPSMKSCAEALWEIRREYRKAMSGTETTTTAAAAAALQSHESRKTLLPPRPPNHL